MRTVALGVDANHRGSAGALVYSKARRALVLAVVLAVAPWSTAAGPRGAAQTPNDWWVISNLEKFTTEGLLADLARMQAELLKDQSRYPVPEYWKNVEDAAHNIREVLRGRGVRTPPIIVPGPSGGTSTAGTVGGGTASGGRAAGGNPGTTLGGRRPAGDTLAIKPADPSAPKNAAGALTLAVVLTGAQIAKCAAEGQDVIACASGAALQAAAGAVAGATIAVLSPTGAVILTAVSVGASIVSTVIGSAEAVGEAAGYGAAWLRERGANAQQAAQQQHNVSVTTPERMEALAAAFGSRITAVGDLRDELAGSLALLDLLAAGIQSAAGDSRSKLDAFRSENDRVKGAGALCADSTRNPVAALARLDRTTTEADSKASAIVKALADAAALPCRTSADARAMRDGYDAATRGVADLSAANRDVWKQAATISDFLGAITAGVTARQAAEDSIELLKQIADDAATTVVAVEDVARSAATLSTRFGAEAGALTAEFDALRGAFPADLSAAPQHIPGALDALAAAVKAAVQLPPGLPVLAEFTRTLADLRTARNAMQDRARLAQSEIRTVPCPVFAEETVAGPLRKQAQADVVALERALGRAQQALEAAADIPGRAALCDGRTTGPAGTAAFAWTGTWQTQDATITLEEVDAAVARRSLAPGAPYAQLSCSDRPDVRFFRGQIQWPGRYHPGALGSDSGWNGVATTLACTQPQAASGGQVPLAGLFIRRVGQPPAGRFDVAGTSGQPLRFEGTYQFFNSAAPAALWTGTKRE